MTTCLVATDVLLSNCYPRLPMPPYLLLPLCQILSSMVIAVTGFLAQKLVWPLLPSLCLTWFLSYFHHSKNHKTKLLSSSQSSLVFLSILYLDGMILSFHSLISYHALSSRNLGEVYLGLEQRVRSKKCSIQNYLPSFTSHPRTRLKLRVGSIQELRGNPYSHHGSRILA